MDLATFITTNLEQILESWEASARQRRGRQRNNRATLRDNAGELLRAIARDLAERRRSGRRPMTPSDVSAGATTAIEAAAEKHAEGRAKLGFTLDEMVSEFPTLRSTVTAMWLRDAMPGTPQDVDDLVHFNASVDVALSESVSEFVDRVNRGRELFLGILGHDLRDPLSTITMSTQLLLEVPSDANQSRQVVRRIRTVTERLQHMVSDLLDFTRSRAGEGIPITRQRANLHEVVRSAVDEVAASHPEHPVQVHVTGDLDGNWDSRRIGQALSNLLGNAVHHGMEKSPIDVIARGEEREVALAVHNEGEPIPLERQPELFDPLSAREGRERAAKHDPNHLGLGLYIAKAIVRGHNGSIDVDSSAEKGTTFTMHLPRA